MKKAHWIGLGLLLISTRLFAAELSSLELGVGALGGESPHYIGSNEYYRGWSPFPYLIARREDLEVGEVNRAFLYNDHRLQLELGLGLEWPVWSERVDSPAPAGNSDPNAHLIHGKSWLRRGMPKHPLNLLVGLTASYHLGEHLYFTLPIRQGVGFIRSLPNMGQTIALGASFDFFPRHSPHALVVESFTTYGNTQFNQLYYGVEPAYALAGRPAYDASAGLLYQSISVWGSFYLGKAFYLGVFVTRYDMRQSRLAQSPLVRSPLSESIGFAVIYKFFVSHKKVKIDK